MKYQKNQVRNTKLKKKTTNAYLMSQNPHQILENDCQWREREREREYRKKPIQSNKQQIKKKKNQTSISNC